MSKKKNKWSFVDLDDKDFDSLSKPEKSEDSLSNLTINDLKKENVKTKTEVETKKVEVQQEEKEVVEFNKNKNESNLISTNQSRFEVNYDDILYKDEDKSKTINELFSEEKEKKPNVVINENGEKEYRNLKPRDTLKTYNEALKNQEKQISANHSFGEDKVKQFLTVKEKLDVKTNIYLKSSIVVKLRELEERTNESRSSIINKLIEMALKNMEE